MKFQRNDLVWVSIAALEASFQMTEFDLLYVEPQSKECVLGIVMNVEVDPDFPDSTYVEVQIGVAGDEPTAECFEVLDDEVYDFATTEDADRLGATLISTIW